MSTWKKAAKTGQKPHRERHQPESRKHLGLLEKKKDYIARARDYNDKQTTLKLLRKRALNKNPDEFHFHMINSKIQDGVHHEKEKTMEHSADQIKLMETQDFNYIVYKRNIEARKIDKLQSHLHMIDAADATQNKHTFFIDNNSKSRKFDIAKHLDIHPALLNRKTNRPRLSELKTMKIPDIDEAAKMVIEQQKHMAYSELQRRIERERELTIVQRKLEVRRALKDKTLEKPEAIFRSTKNSAPVYKWKFQRKR